MKLVDLGLEVIHLTLKALEGKSINGSCLLFETLLQLLGQILHCKGLILIIKLDALAQRMEDFVHLLVQLLN